MFWLRCNVAVGEHDAFGLAGGAGCVDQRGEVVGFHRADKGVENRIPIRAGDRRRLPVSWKERWHPSGASPIHDEDPLQLSLGAHGIQLFKLLPGGNDGDATACVLRGVRRSARRSAWDKWAH